MATEISKETPKITSEETPKVVSEEEELKKYEDEFRSECNKLIKISLSTDVPNEYLVSSVFKHLNTNKNGNRYNFTGMHWEQITLGGTWKIVTPVIIRKVFVNELYKEFVRYQSELIAEKTKLTGTFYNSSGIKENEIESKKVDAIMLSLWNSDFLDRLLKMCEIQLSK